MNLKVENISFKYKNDDVLKNISFEAKTGNLIAILGKNGVGKSTLFKIILRIIKNYSGLISIDGTNIKDFSQKSLAQSIAYIPQSQDKVLPYTVEEMVLMGTTSILNTFEMPNKKSYLLMEDALSSLNLEHLRDRNFNELSGGERQLVLIARAIAQQAKILVMDEPCSNLDYGNQIKVMEYISNLAKSGYLILFSTHNPEHAQIFADKVLILNDGKSIIYGNTDEVMSEPTLSEIYKIPILIRNIEQLEQKVVIPDLKKYRKQ
ncbi:ABC transporter family protein [Chlamydia trachomatis]|nr:ABC transporter family protein [Chlamydia trachomatis]